jgi:threonine dehydrogenase-like Zn-dependent dehydrogenase
MRAVVMHAPGDVRVDQVADPAIELPTDAVIRVTAACVCGSDLWRSRWGTSTSAWSRRSATRSPP